MKDSKNNLDAAFSLAPKVYSTNQVENGAGVDLQGFDSAMVVFVSGGISDGTFTPKIQDSTDDITYTDVAAEDQDGALANLTASAVMRVGYRGAKRYVRPVVTVSGATSGGALASLVVRGTPHIAPAA